MFEGRSVTTKKKLTRLLFEQIQLYVGGLPTTAAFCTVRF
jgi:hypothetical protein